ncbi:AbgT family transporter [Brevundimonas sp. LF-1]|uniref:AbgT family transporter n=1 Tax=Brevundimonas sp. LF-1 TaxID=3126100 RepID=UPI0030E37B5C
MNLAARLLNTVERIGNRLPDPVFLFLWLILGLVVLSLVGAGLGWSAVNPVTGEVLQAQSLLAPPIWSGCSSACRAPWPTSRRWGSSSPSSTAPRWPSGPACSRQRSEARC